MSADKEIGEGNREADRRYRRGVKKTVENTSEAERERLAKRPVSDDDKTAEEQARSRARGDSAR